MIPFLSPNDLKKQGIEHRAVIIVPGFLYGLPLPCATFSNLTQIEFEIRRNFKLTTQRRYLIPNGDVYRKLSNNFFRTQPAQKKPKQK